MSLQIKGGRLHESDCRISAGSLQSSQGTTHKSKAHKQQENNEEATKTLFSGNHYVIRLRNSFLSLYIMSQFFLLRYCCTVSTPSVTPIIAMEGSREEVRIRRIRLLLSRRRGKKKADENEDMNKKKRMLKIQHILCNNTLKFNKSSLSLVILTSELLLSYSRREKEDKNCWGKNQN